jgi:HlyD family secretion protein
MKPSKKRRRKWLWLAVLLLVAGGTAAPLLMRHGDEAIAVQVTKVTRRDLLETVTANGHLQPVTQVVISPEVAGEIVKLPVVEGQRVKKGELLVQIREDQYLADRNSAEANYKFAQGSRDQAEAELLRAETQFHQNDELRKSRLISESAFIDFKTTYEVAKLKLANSIHQADQAKFALDKAIDDLTKTTIVSPIDGTVTKLKSQLGERVLGTSFNMGTEIMTLCDLQEMEARVDVGELDVVLIKVGQNARLEVDAFKDRTFKGTVSATANASKAMNQPQISSSSNTPQEAPKFEVRIRMDDKEKFLPGMSVTAEIETRERKGALAVPIQSVTTRLPKGGATPAPTPELAATPRPGKANAPVKPIEVVFVLEGDHVRALPVKTGISDSDYFEIVSGLKEGDEIVSGGYKAISKDLEDGKKVKRSTEPAKPAKDEK